MLNRSSAPRLNWARASLGLLGGLMLATPLAMLTGLCWPGSNLAGVFATSITLPLYWTLLMLASFAARRLARMAALMLLLALFATVLLHLIW